MNSYEENFQKRLDSLNDKQREAVEAIDGPVLVIAGPGSGKTELLSLRAANILKNGFVGPQNILLLTFTDSGSHNMRERLVGLIGEAGYRVAIYTFHAFAADVMNKYPEYFWQGATFKPATDIENLSILENILSKLDRDNPLASKHLANHTDAQGQEYEKISFTYLKDIMSCISALKKANLNGEEFVNIITKHKTECDTINQKVSEILLSIKGARKFDIIKDAFANIYGILSDIEGNDMAKHMSETLSLEIKEALDTETSKNLTAWKDKYFTKSEDGESIILKDSLEKNIKRWLSLGEVYNTYQKEMNNSCFYDFDDMIFKVARELKVNINLRNELEEKYQYIMIDEFQDTSDAQFDLVKYLSLSPINEGMPNILAVGDDDQAIFKFQGAKLDNITKFVESFNNVKFITLDKNYRSTQNILNRAREVITFIDDRLENRYKGQINKNIQAANKKLTENITGQIIEKEFENEFLEYDFITNKIQELLSQNVDPKEISVIAINHNTLKNITKFLIDKNIPFSYQKKENCLDKLPIKEIINIVDFVNSGLENNLKDELLPEILSYKFWGLERIDIWKIAEKVRAGTESVGEIGERIWKRETWMNVILNSENEKIKNIGEFLIHLISIAESTPLELLLDKIIGTKEWEIIGEYDDNFISQDEENINQDINIKNKEEGKLYNYVSPFREYYFGKENFDHNKTEYLEFLFALRTFMGALREYKQGETLYARDLPIFVSIYKNNNLDLSIESPFATSEKAIVLQTAYKSKGLEYEYVFIVNSDQKTWTSKGKANMIGMPENLPILNERDTIDDKVRLYFVAMTRAKHTLYITNNKEKFSILLGSNAKENERESETDYENISESIVNNLYIKDKRPLIEDEKVLLKRLLENYKMPVTHMINFLNFSKVGPDKFIEQNLLRFPQAMSPSSIYGSAMHEAMQNYYIYKNKFLEKPEIDKVFNYFENNIKRGALSKIDLDKYTKSGKANLEFYIHDLEKRGESHILFENKKEIKVEIDMNKEGCNIDGVEITGKIDKIIFDSNSIKIIDLKTGSSPISWDKGKSDYEKIKLHFYKYQLAYYYILIKRSRSYNKYNIDSLHLEFVEKDNNNNINILSIFTDNQEFLDTVSRVENLIKIVYNKIMNLDFVNISKYMLDKKGLTKSIDKVKLEDIIAFEDDLLQNKI